MSICMCVSHVHPSHWLLLTLFWGPSTLCTPIKCVLCPSVTLVDEDPVMGPSTLLYIFFILHAPNFDLYKYFFIHK